MKPPPKQTLAQRVRQSSQKRRDTEKATIRARILRAAASLLLAEGYEGVSLRKVAERIGYSATTIYRHFRDKDDMMRGVLEDGFRLFELRMHEAVQGPADPFDRLRSIARAYVRFGLENPILYRLMFLQKGDTLPEPLRAEFDEQPHPMEPDAQFGFLVEVVRELIATGKTRSKDVYLLMHVLWATVHGVVALAIAGPPHPAEEIQAMAEETIETLLRGLQ